LESNPERESGITSPSVFLGDLTKVFKAARLQPLAIPASVLAEAPHLQEYIRMTQTNDHLEQMWRL
jgi:hypothetical protein